MSEPPNVLWIQTDEQRPDSLGCYGSAWAKTPHLDRLAERGTVFTAALCQSPVCAPSRASQLTGLYPQECNTLNNAVASCEGVFPPGTTSFPEVFRSAGYETVSLGKAHVPAHPIWERLAGSTLDRRYAGYYGLNEAYSEDAHHVIKRPGGTPVILAGTYPVREGNPGQVLTDEAIAFLSGRDGDRPFLLRVSHNWPHTPVLPPPPFDQLYDPDEIPIQFYDDGAYRTRSAYDRRRADSQRMRDLSPEQIRQVWKDYMGLAAYVDHETGRLLDALDALALTDKTIVVFSADHGKLLGEWGATEEGVFDDPVWRVPFVWSWPGRVGQGEVRDDLCELLDTGRTLLALAGLEDRTPEAMRGRSLFADPAPDAVFGQIGWPNVNVPFLRRDGVRQGPLKSGSAMRVAVRTRRCRMDIDWVRDGRRVPPEQADGNLFDLATDPLEKRNLWNDPAHEPVRAELTGRLRDWQDEIRCGPEIFGAAPSKGDV